MLPRTARPTPAFGIAEAAAHAIDLTAHRSRYLAQDVAEGAALLIVFDERNRRGVRALYPGLTTPLIKLGDLSDGQDIPDPFGAVQEKYAEVYRKILRGVRALAALGVGR